MFARALTDCLHDSAQPTADYNCPSAGNLASDSPRKLKQLGATLARTNNTNVVMTHSA